jgi:hypothetical protein
MRFETRWQKKDRCEAVSLKRGFTSISVIADVDPTPLPTIPSMYSTNLVASVIVRVVSVVIIKAEGDSDDSEPLFVMTMTVVMMAGQHQSRRTKQQTLR